MTDKKQTAEEAAYAVDFETFYDSEYSLSKMSTWKYVFDEKFDAYLVAVKGPDIRWVGHPEDFDWNQLQGKDLLFHNASFDALVIQRLQKDGIIPPLKFRAFCTADLAAYLKVPRDLKRASKELLGVVVDKAQRDAAKGKTGAQIMATDAKGMLDYGMGDSDNTYAIWCKYGAQWPECERELSRLNREAAWHGIAVDVAGVDAAIDSLSKQLFEADAALPWVTEGEKPLSTKALRIEARKCGIPVPASLAQTSPEADAWVKEYGDLYPWVKAVGQRRKINVVYKKFISLRKGIRDEDGTFPYAIKYHGAGTGRFSGGGSSGGKVNIQNLPRDEMYDTDLRGSFRARPGKVLCIIDYCQVEAILLQWRVGNQETLNLIAGGMDIYEAYARVYMGYSRAGKLKDAAKDDPALGLMRRLSKAVVLGLGFGCGHVKFQTVARMMAGLELTPAECLKTVTEFRGNNPRVTEFWREHQQALARSAYLGDGTHQVELASGRILTYWYPKRNVRKVDPKDPRSETRTEYTVWFTKGDPATCRHIYGGLLTENEIQATARDLLRDAWIALAAAGYNVLFTVHDEFVIELDKKDASDHLPLLQKIILSASPWANGCPLGVDMHLSEVYSKD